MRDRGLDEEKRIAYSADLGAIIAIFHPSWLERVE
jgi:hypothetical protein